MKLNVRRWQAAEHDILLQMHSAEHLENPDLSSDVNATEQQVDYIS